MYPRSGFRSGGTSECTLVPVFVPGEHPPKPPFWKSTGYDPFCQAANHSQSTTLFLRNILDLLSLALFATLVAWYNPQIPELPLPFVQMALQTEKNYLWIIMHLIADTDTDENCFGTKFS